MSTIKFRKGFSKFMIPIALLEKFGRQRFISSVEVCNMIADSSKPNKLRNVYQLTGKEGDFTRLSVNIDNIRNDIITGDSYCMSLQMSTGHERFAKQAWHQATPTNDLPYASLNIFYCLFMYSGVGLQVLSTLGSARPLQHNNSAKYVKFEWAVTCFSRQ